MGSKKKKQKPPTTATTHDLEIHLAFEVYWLIHAAVQYRDTVVEGTVFQNSVFLNARNLLEFTKPWNPTYGWWIVEFGGTKPPPLDKDPEFDTLNTWINAKVSHLGEDRLTNMDFPLSDTTNGRFVTLANYCLDRIEKFAPDKTDPRGEVVHRLLKLARDYLGGDVSALAKLNVLTTGRCPGSLIVHRDGTVKRCTEDDEPAGCRGNGLEHESSPIPCLTWEPTCDYCGVQ